MSRLNADMTTDHHDRPAPSLGGWYAMYLLTSISAGTGDPSNSTAGTGFLGFLASPPNSLTEACAALVVGTAALWRCASVASSSVFHSGVSIALGWRDVADVDPMTLCCCEVPTGDPVT